MPFTTTPRVNATVAVSYQFEVHSGILDPHSGLEHGHRTMRTAERTAERSRRGDRLAQAISDVGTRVEDALFEPPTVRIGRRHTAPNPLVALRTTTPLTEFENGIANGRYLTPTVTKVFPDRQSRLTLADRTTTQTGGYMVLADRPFSGGPTVGRTSRDSRYGGVRETFEEAATAAQYLSQTSGGKASVVKVELFCVAERNDEGWKQRPDAEIAQLLEGSQFANSIGL